MSLDPRDQQLIEWVELVMGTELFDWQRQVLIKAAMDHRQMPPAVPPGPCGIPLPITDGWILCELWHGHAGLHENGLTTWTDQASSMKKCEANTYLPHQGRPHRFFCQGEADHSGPHWLEDGSTFTL